MTEQQLLARIEETAAIVGLGDAHRSTMFDLLALLLAYYEVRGTPMAAMTTENDRMRRTVAWMLSPENNPDKTA